MARAREWSLRCSLELQLHDKAAWTTLTYDEEALPPTLRKPDLSGWLKRFRKAMGPTRIRFFGSGEYGEQNGRPHYHVLLYGADPVKDRDTITETWGQGRTFTVQVTPANIAYTAGYTAKKIGFKKEAATERVDPETGEVYHWEPPFILMSRRPGIGGEARKYTESWRMYAVHNGTRMPVPRFLHDAWREKANPEQVERLLYEKQQIALERDAVTKSSIEAGERIEMRKQELRGSKRQL